MTYIHFWQVFDEVGSKEFEALERADDKRAFLLRPR